MKAPARGVVAVRHAALAAENRCIGRTDEMPALHPAEAAGAIVRALCGASPVCVWTSPLRRCREPAARVAERLGAPLAVDRRLSEVDFGRWEGRAWSDIARAEPEVLGVWMADWRNVPAPGGESAADLEARVRAWWQALPRDGVHLLVAHAGVVRALRTLAGGQSWAAAMALPVAHLAAEWFLRDGAVTTGAPHPQAPGRGPHGPPA